MRRCDCRATFPPHFVSFAWRYHRSVSSFAPHRRERATVRPGVWVRDLPSELSSGVLRLSQVPGEPRLCLGPALGPRLDLRTRPCSASARPPLPERRRLSELDTFRGSMTRLWHSLSTLRSLGHPTPRKTRFRLLAKLYRTGLVTRRVPVKGFRHASYITSSFPKLCLAQSGRATRALIVPPRRPPFLIEASGKRLVDGVRPTVTLSCRNQLLSKE
jgi:hypothetical protein